MDQDKSAVKGATGEQKRATGKKKSRQGKAKQKACGNKKAKTKKKH